MMVTVRTAKSKGSSFEYDCQESLAAIYPDIYRTSERGFQLQYDLEANTAVFECKRLAGISWNQAIKFMKKLQDKAPCDKKTFLLFKSNRQPCLVMVAQDVSTSLYKIEYMYHITTFESVFGIPFVKHASTRKRK